MFLEEKGRKSPGQKWELLSDGSDTPGTGQVLEDPSQTRVLGVTRACCGSETCTINSLNEAKLLTKRPKSQFSAAISLLREESCPSNVHPEIHQKQEENGTLWAQGSRFNHRQ